MVNVPLPSVSKSLNSIQSATNKSKSFLNKTKKKLNNHKQKLNSGLKTLKNTQNTLQKTGKNVLSQINNVSKMTSDFLPTSLLSENKKKRENSQKQMITQSVQKQKSETETTDNPSLLDDITNVKDIFMSLANIKTDNDELNKQLKMLKLQTNASKLTPTPTQNNLSKYSNSVDQLLSFMNDSSIATMHIAYLNLQKGYIVTQLKKLQPLLDKIYGTYETIKNIITTVDNAKDKIVNMKNKAEHLSNLWIYLQYLLGMFTGTLLNILSKTALRTLDKIDIEKILRVIHQIKEEEMEYFLKAFENKDNKTTNTKHTNGLKLAQTIVLLLYLIHRTIVEGVDNLDQGLIHMEPLFKKLLKIATNIDNNIIGPIGEVAITATNEINKNKKLIKDVQSVIPPISMPNPSSISKPLST